MNAVKASPNLKDSTFGPVFEKSELQKIKNIKDLLSSFLEELVTILAKQRGMFSPFKFAKCWLF